MKLQASLVVVICALFAPTAASAATVEVPAEFDTIQEAVDASNDGDTIGVQARKRPYREQITVPHNDLKIKGLGDKRPVLVAYNGVTFDPGFDITGNGVSLSGFEIHHGEAIECTADDCSVTNSVFRGESTSDCIGITGADAVVKNNTFTGCDSNAVSIVGADAKVTGNKASLADSDCFDITSANLLFRDNKAFRCEDGSGLLATGADMEILDSSVTQVDNELMELTGTGMTVRGVKVAETDDECFTITGGQLLFEKNKASNCTDGSSIEGASPNVKNSEFDHSGDDDCLDLTGDNAKVAGNIADVCYLGMTIRGENPVVTDNKASRAVTDDGINVNCPDNGSGLTACEDMLVANNVAQNAGEDDEGIRVFAPEGLEGGVIRDNRASKNQGDGMSFQLDGALIEGNRSTSAGAEEEPGIEVTGNGNTVRDNVSSSNGGPGFVIDGDENEVTKNLAKNNALDGIRIVGVDNEVVSNEAIGNLADGIENDVDSTGTVARKNKASGNEFTDCANDGTLATNQSNKCADGSNFDEPSGGIDRKSRR